jgi:TPR repeat protein
VQVRNSLKRLVESGAISGSKADAWKQAMAEEAEVVALRAEAEGGNADSMCALAQRYDAGTHGLRKDFAQSFKWYKRAADLKHVFGLTNCGVAYLVGEGVERSGTRGIAMLGAAAALGSEHACALLGEANAEGFYGFDADPQEATRWYREMQKCATRGSPDEYREQAAAWLREHP